MHGIYCSQNGTPKLIYNNTIIKDWTSTTISTSSPPSGIMSHFCATFSNFSHTQVVCVQDNINLDYSVGTIFSTGIPATFLRSLKVLISDDTSNICFVFGAGDEVRFGCHRRIDPWGNSGAPSTGGTAIDTMAPVIAIDAAFVPNSTIVLFQNLIFLISHLFCRFLLL